MYMCMHTAITSHFQVVTYCIHNHMYAHVMDAYQIVGWACQHSKSIGNFGSLQAYGTLASLITPV